MPGLQYIILDQMSLVTPPNSDGLKTLKGQCHEIFCFRFFSWITFPQAPENNTRVITNFSNICGDIRKSRCTTGVNDNGGKLPPVSTTPAANLPQASLTQVANNGTISGCRHLKVNLKAKIYIYVSSTTQRWPNKIIKIFLIEDFFHLTPVANLELRKFSKKFKTVLMEYSGGWGETDPWKEPEAKNLVTQPL